MQHHPPSALPVFLPVFFLFLFLFFYISLHFLCWSLKLMMMAIMLLMMILTMTVVMTMLLMMMMTPWCKVVTSIWWCLSMTHSIIWPCPPPYSHIQVAPASGEVFLPVFFSFYFHSLPYFSPLFLVYLSSFFGIALFGAHPHTLIYKHPASGPPKRMQKVLNPRKWESIYVIISSTVRERHFRMSSIWVVGSTNSVWLAGTVVDMEGLGMEAVHCTRWSTKLQRLNRRSKRVHSSWPSGKKPSSPVFLCD